MEMPVDSFRQDGLRLSGSHLCWMIHGCPISHRLTRGRNHRSVPRADAECLDFVGHLLSAQARCSHLSSPRSHRRRMGRKHGCVPLADAGCLGSRVAVGMPTLTGCAVSDEDRFAQKSPPCSCFLHIVPLYGDTKFHYMIWRYFIFASTTGATDEQVLK